MVGKGLRIGLVLAVFVAGLISVAVAGEVTSVTFCEDVAKPAMDPINPLDHYTADALQLNAVVVVEKMTPGSTVRGTWVSVDAISVPDYEIDSAEMVVNGKDARVHFSLSRPNQGWPLGNYRLDLYIDGDPAGHKPFSIVNAQ